MSHVTGWDLKVDKLKTRRVDDLTGYLYAQNVPMGTWLSKAIAE